MTHTRECQSLIIDSSCLTFNPYLVPIASKRTGPLFRLHPYPTKIDYRSIVPFILAHTNPGDVVYDSFAGTCSTGIAAAACSEYDPQILADLNQSTIRSIQWGQRRAICLDIGMLPTFIGRTLLRSIDIKSFKKLFDKVMTEIEEEWGWLYGASDLEGNKGIIRYTIYSDVISCPNCSNQARFIDLFVDFVNGDFLPRSECPVCKTNIVAGKAKRYTEAVYDDLLRSRRFAIKRVPVTIYGRTKKKFWIRDANAKDTLLLKKIHDTPLPKFAKAIPMLSGKPKWGEMHRAGYHQDITHVHHFYTRRNYLALCILYDAAKKFPKEFRDHYLLLVSSYNVSNSSLMARFVFKKNKNKPVITSTQPGSLYISGCPVEKNVFHGIRQKFKELEQAIIQVQCWKPKVDVYPRPSQSSELPSNSIDYIFTDPPFAENIQYSEINFLSEAWLGSFTDNEYETIISKVQNKTMSDYEDLLTLAFKENFRVLKSGKFMTVVFHNAHKEAWNALRRSIVSAGFRIVDSSILDKLQTSFKQTTTKGAVKKDPIIAAIKPSTQNANWSSRSKKTIDDFLETYLSSPNNVDSRYRTFDYIYSRYIGWCLETNCNFVDAKELGEILTKVAEQHESSWYLLSQNREWSK